jgi:hypothetical protein
LSENDTTETGATVPALFGEGDALKFALRDSKSIDKNGNYASAEVGSSNPDDPNYISANGMGWFPGYAIDVETGRRLNIVYGEASELPGENGRDMKWNPTSNAYSNFGEVLFGGKHYIYIVGNNFYLNQENHVDTSTFMPAYDGCAYFNTLINSTSSLTRRKAYQNLMWCAIPMLSGAYNGQPFENALAATEIKVQLRMANPIRAGHFNFSIDNPVNDNFPVYRFNTKDVKTVKNDTKTAKESLDLVNIVPNPYYGYSEYELNQIENLVKITNLPQRCTISIYNVNGTLIRRFRKDSQLSYQEWDLKNQYGIPIASGIYIIHVDAFELGEKVLKWFGALRPTDLNAF